MTNGYIRIVNNHVVKLNTGRLIILSYPTERVEEKTIPELHDIGFVYASHFLYFTMKLSLPQVLFMNPTLRLFFKAKSKAKREIRSAFARVETFKLSTTPG